MTKLKPVNLIPKEILRKPLLKQAISLYQKSKELRKLAMVASIVVSIILVRTLTVGIFKWGLGRSKRIMRQTKAELNQLQSEHLQLENIKSGLLKQQALQEQRTELLRSTSSEDREYSELLAGISELVPQELWIKNCILNEEEVLIIGATVNNQLITQFMNQLNQSGIFKNSHFASSEKEITDSHTFYNFQITTEPVWDVDNREPPITDNRQPNTAENR